MRILITGSREWTNVEEVRRVLGDALATHGPFVLVSGGARGADRICEAVARELGCEVEVHPAQWSVHGRRAGFIRNALMVDLGADVCYAFIKNNSAGASHTAALAEGRGIPTIRYEELD